MPTDEWFWACGSMGPALDKFVIENGQDALWRRVRREIDANEHCAWMHIQRTNKPVEIGDILDMMLTVVPCYRVNHNRFVMEAAKIPVFAKFVRNGRADLCNYVSNSTAGDAPLPVEPFSNDSMRALGRAVSDTLDVEPDWFE